LCREETTNHSQKKKRGRSRQLRSRKKNSGKKGTDAPKNREQKGKKRNWQRQHAKLGRVPLGINPPSRFEDPNPAGKKGGEVKVGHKTPGQTKGERSSSLVVPKKGAKKTKPNQETLGKGAQDRQPSPSGAAHGEELWTILKTGRW